MGFVVIGSATVHPAALDLHDEYVMRPLPWPWLVPLPSMVEPSEILLLHVISIFRLGKDSTAAPLLWSLICFVPVENSDPFTCQKGPEADAEDVITPLAMKRASTPNRTTLVFNIGSAFPFLNVVWVSD